jgi:hypothetical protein
MPWRKWIKASASDHATSLAACLGTPPFLGASILSLSTLSYSVFTLHCSQCPLFFSFLRHNLEHPPPSGWTPKPARASRGFGSYTNPLYHYMYTHWTYVISIRHGPKTLHLLQLMCDWIKRIFCQCWRKNGFVGCILSWLIYIYFKDDLRDF